MSAAKQESASRLPGGLKGWLGAAALLLGVVLVFGVLAAWKYANIQQAMAAAADQPEPMETITIATASPREHRQTVTSIGTVLALRSITLKNEMPGTVQEVKLTPGQIVEAGDVLVALDVSVEQAELKAHEAEAALAETVLSRYERAGESHAVSMIEIDRARAQRDVAVAQIARIKAIIDRKTIFAPFKSRVGMADVHPGQYLEEGTELTTLQGIEDPPAVHVDFTVTQQVAGGLAVGDNVDVIISNQLPSAAAKIIAIDARVDQATRNAWVRARLESPPADTGKAAELPAPGASVRVRVPVGSPRIAVSVPVISLRKSPAGDHVFVIAADQQGKQRAAVRPVRSGPMLGDEIMIIEGLQPGEQVAAAGSFKLRPGVLVTAGGS